MDQIIIVILLLLSLILIYTITYYRIYKKRIRLEKDQLTLKNDFLKDSLEYLYRSNELYQKSLNDQLHLKNGNFNGVSDRYYYEIKNLRKELKTTIDLLSNQSNNSTKNSENTYDYSEFMRMLSNMTNIQYLIELLQSDEDKQITYVQNILGDVVHTLRNPVSGIRAVFAIIKMEDLDSNLREKIATVENYFEQIEKDLNAYYEITQMNYSLVDQNEKVDLKEEILKRSKLLIVSSGKKIEIKESMESFQVEKNIAEILLLAFACIFENAIAFSPDNNEIRVLSTFKNEQLLLEVENNGPIIEEEIIKSIFSQGFSTRKSSGRGLAIAKKAIEEKLGGILDCQNIGDKNGVKFSILVEVHKDDE